MTRIYNNVKSRIYNNVKCSGEVPHRARWGSAPVPIWRRGVHGPGHSIAPAHRRRAVPSRIGLRREGAGDWRRRRGYHRLSWRYRRPAGDRSGATRRVRHRRSAGSLPLRAVWGNTCPMALGRHISNSSGRWRISLLICIGLICIGRSIPRSAGAGSLRRSSARHLNAPCPYVRPHCSSRSTIVAPGALPIPVAQAMIAALFSH